MNMRQGGPGGSRRPRGRHNGGNGGGGGGQPPRGGQDNRPRSASALRHQTFDSNGPDVRVRGNAWQVYEKYQSLARDAQGSGDRVLAESYLQHAEHYYRITEAINEAMAAEQRVRTGSSPQPFGGQPDVPANYYAPDGQLMGGAQPVPQAPQGAMSADPATMPQPGETGQAEVVRRTPPPQPSPFFAPEETDESDSGPQTLAASR